MVIAAPPSSTTTTASFSAATASRSATCEAGSSRDSRSPAPIMASPSSFAVSPTTATTTSAFVTAVASSGSPRSPDTWVTVTAPAAAVRPSSAVTIEEGRTLLEPVSPMFSTSASGPTKTRFVTALRSMGSTPPFRRSTMPRSAASRASAIAAGVSRRLSSRAGGSASTPKQKRARKRRRTDSSMTASSTSPAATASSSGAPK